MITKTEVKKLIEEMEKQIKELDDILENSKEKDTIVIMIMNREFAIEKLNQLLEIVE